MVKSGLTGRVDVSQYRLSLHLTIAFIVLGLVFFTLLRFNSYQNNLRLDYDLVKRRKLILTIFVLIFFQIVYSSFVSGTDSGLLYNTWPLYDGKFLPNELVIQNKLLFNFFENKKFIIFFHRTFAFILLFLIAYLNFTIFRKNTNYKTVILVIVFDIVFNSRRTWCYDDLSKYSLVFSTSTPRKFNINLFIIFLYVRFR